MSDLLECKQQGRVFRITLNRPDKRNALNMEICRALVDTFERANRDRSSGAILLDANGKAFSAGMDLDEVRNRVPADINNFHEQLFTIGARITKPIICAVHGAALAGGMGLVANCHIVIAAPDSTFGLTEIRLGLWPFLVFRAVTAAIGERHALALALTGRIFSAEEARQFSLVHEITPDPHQRAFEIAESIGAMSPTAVRIGMRFTQQIRNQDWDVAGEIARRVRDEVFQSRDFQEGLHAFFEKRPPKWPSLE